MVLSPFKLTIGDFDHTNGKTCSRSLASFSPYPFLSGEWKIFPVPSKDSFKQFNNTRIDDKFQDDDLFPTQSE